MQEKDSFIKRISIFLIGFLGLTFLVYIFSYLGIFKLLFKIFSVDIFNKKVEFNMNINVILNYSIYFTIFFIIILIINKSDVKEFLLGFKVADNIKEGIAFGVILITFSLVYQNLLRLIMPITENQNQTGVNNIILNNPLLATVTVAIIGPVVEEFTYRYGLFGSIRKFNRVASYVVTIIVFALIHFNYSADSSTLLNEILNLPPYLFAAFILCYAYDTRSLTCSTVAHIFNNGYSVIMLLLSTLIEKYAK